MKKTHYVLLFVALNMLFSLAVTEAQVRYKIQWLEAEAAWQVSVVPEATWVSPHNITSSAQVTLKAAVGSLKVANLKNLVSSVIWVCNSEQKAPAEAPGFDYFSFGMATLGATGIPYQKGVELPLFTFQNANPCNSTEVAFINNESDPFMPPNSAQVNIGNQMTVFGAGGDAYKGFIGEGKATCTELVLPTNGTTAEVTRFEVFPTTVSNIVNLDAQWAQAAQAVTVRIFDLAGKKAFEQKYDFVRGENSFKIEADRFASGAYSVEVSYDDTRQAAGRFVKQ